MPLGGLADGLNFRVKNKKVSNLNLGWESFNSLQLNGPVRLVTNFLNRTGAQRLIFASLKDIYLFNEGPKTVSFLSPRYEDGTINVTNGSPNIVGAGTLWATNLKAGDQIAFGATGIVDPGYTTNGGWYTVQTVTDDTHIVLTANYSGANNAAIAYTGRKLFTGTIDDIWDNATFFNAPGGVDLWMATNGKDFLVKWDGTGTQVTLLSGLGIKAKTIVAYKNMMLYGGVTDTASGNVFPTSIANSDVGQPEVLNAGLAGQFQVHDGQDFITHLRVLSDSAVVYSERHVVLAQFVGDPLVFVFRIAVQDHGPISGGVVADFGGHHEFLGRDSGYFFDGTTVRPVNSHVWRSVLRTRDPSRANLAFCAFDEENGDLIWSIPLTTDGGTQGATVAYAQHYLEEVPQGYGAPFSRRDFPFTAVGFFQRSTSLTWADMTGLWESTNFAWNDHFFAAAFPFIIAGDETGKLWTYGTSQLRNGVAYQSYIVSGRAPLVDGRVRALVSRVYPFATQLTDKTIDIYLRLSDHAAGPDNRVGPYTFDADLLEGGHFVTPYRRARFGAVEFFTSADAWELSGWDVDIRQGGER